MRGQFHGSWQRGLDLWNRFGIGWIVASRSAVGMKLCLSSAVNRQERKWSKETGAWWIWPEASESPPTFPCFNFLMAYSTTTGDTYTSSMSVKTDSRLFSSSVEGEVPWRCWRMNWQCCQDLKHYNWRWRCSVVVFSALQTRNYDWGLGAMPRPILHVWCALVSFSRIGQHTCICDDSAF